MVSPRLYTYVVFGWIALIIVPTVVIYFVRNPDMLLAILIGMELDLGGD